MAGSDAWRARATEARFQGRKLLAARGVWLALAGVVGVLFLLNVLGPVYGGTTSLCPFSSTCGYAPATAAALRHWHIGRHLFDVYLVMLGLIDAVITVGIGILIFMRKSDSPSSWLASATLLMLGGTLLAGDDSTMTLGLQGVLSIVLIFAMVLCIGFFIVTFPDGRLVPRWAWLPGSSLFLQALLYQLPGAWNLENWPAALAIPEALLGFGSPVAVQIYRYRRIATPSQRQQTRWVIFALVCFVVFSAAAAAVEGIFPALNARNSLYPLVSASLVPSIAVLAIPLGISVAVLRSQLWDIDILINRTLVYGSLTAMLVLFYIVDVIALQSLFRLVTGQTSELAIAISTLVIAALFGPLRRSIQTFIDRRFYRRKYDAARTLASFGSRLHTEVDIDQLQGDLLSVIQETIQPVHASLWLRE